MITSDILERSVQVNNGLAETSADGAGLVFDAKYGIMFCAYMPGHQGHYGESRGKIALSYFPASQPTNIRFVTVSEDKDVYCHNVWGLGEGRVRVFYEKDSRAEGDHAYCFKDFDFLSGTLSEERTVMVKTEDGSLVPHGLSVKFAYLEARGYHDHRCVKTEQIGHCEYFKGEDGYTYGAMTSYLSEVVLYRSADDGATVEPFAVYPHPAQYEFEYRILDGKIYAIYRTEPEIDSIYVTTSDDMGKTWSEPTVLDQSVSCRPRLILHNGHVLIAYNYYNADTKNRPAIAQGRTSVRIRYGDNLGAQESPIVADLYSKCGIVNMCLVDVLGDAYFAYSTSELALEYQNGSKRVRGKDAIRYVKLGDLSAEI